MRSESDKSAQSPTRSLVTSGVVLLVLLLQACVDEQPLEPWHTEKLTEELTADMVGDRVHTFADYLALEARLFRQLDEQIYAKIPTGTDHTLARFSRGSSADPDRRRPNWNRTFELQADSPVGGVLLLHGMSDSPYSLRSLAETLSQRGFQILGLRLPGHGTAPSGLQHVTWQDMAAAVRLAVEHLASESGDQPIHIIGYSTGAPLALDYALEAIEGTTSPIPASLVLISPAIRVHPASALARFKDALSALPGLGGLAYLSIMDEFDPFKYNSFATNAGAQVHAITRNLDRRIKALAQDAATAEKLPPILALKSTVDSTVTTEAIVDNLLARLPVGRNELVLFDINRGAAIRSTLLVSDPAPLTDRLMRDATLPFAVTLVTNESPQSQAVVARHKEPFSVEKAEARALGLDWPGGVVSLSHIALPFPPDDPLYGRGPPAQDGLVFLGDMAFTGERGLLRIPGEWLLRMRYNPFYAYLQERVVGWLEDSRD